MPKIFQESNILNDVNIERDYYIPSRHATLKSPRKNDSALTTPPTFMQHSRPIRESIKSSPSAKITQRNPS